MLVLSLCFYNLNKMCICHGCIDKYLYPINIVPWYHRGSLFGSGLIVSLAELDIEIRDHRLNIIYIDILTAAQSLVEGVLP